MPNWANVAVTFSVAGTFLAIFVIGLIAFSVLVKREPWMDTARMPVSETTIAIVTAENGEQAWVLAPKICVGADFQLRAGCESRSILLPIKP